MNYIKLFCKGIIIGIANVIPGVSGGTIAVVMGVFDELIDAVNNFYKDLIKYFSFLIPLGAGAVAGIFLFSRVVSYCLANYPLPTNLFFAGLIAGSLPLIYGRATSRAKLNLPALVFGVAVVAALMVVNGSEAREAITKLDLKTALLLLSIGAIASAAMVMPGVSGSFVLVLLGYYGTFITAVSDLNIPVLAVICTGVLLGILIISKIIDILMKNAYTVTYSAILGLIAASLVSILWDKSLYASGVTAASAVLGGTLAVAGFIVAFKLGD